MSQAIINLLHTEAVLVRVIHRSGDHKRIERLTIAARRIRAQINELVGV